MSEGVFIDGHLSWPLFCIVVYTLLALLVTDLVWRLVKLRSIVLVSLALGVWLLGVLGVWVGVYR